MDAGEHADFNPDHHDIVSEQRYWEEEVMTPPADRFARLRESWANVMNTDLDDAAGDARMIVEALPTLLTALDAAAALATAVEAHNEARINAHALGPETSDEEWMRLKKIELAAWWQAKTAAQKYRDATKG